MVKLFFFNVNLGHKLVKNGVFLLTYLIYICSCKTQKLNVMKQIMKNSLILLVVLMLNTTYGSTSGNDKSNGKKITYITFKNVKAGSILTLKTESGTEMYSEVIETSGVFTKLYDFTLLPEGDYAFELEKDFEVKIKPLTIEANKVYLNSDDESVFYKPVVNLKDNKILISQLALNGNPLTIKLYYTKKGEDEVLLYRATYQNNEKHIIEKVLSLSKNYKGEYRIVLSSNGQDYSDMFTL